MRAYLLATPVIKQGDGTPGGRQITVQSQLVGAPDSFWDKIGWGAFKSDTHRSTLAAVLTPDRLDSLLQAVKETKDAGMANPSPPRICRDGERIQLSWAIPEVNESQSGLLMGIDLYPRIAPDSLSVDLELLPSVVSSNEVAHGSLRQTAAPTSSAPP
jgi:hypothetical protein